MQETGCLIVLRNRVVFLIEAEMLGIQALGSDFDPMMVHGSLQNVLQERTLCLLMQRICRWEIFQWMPW